MRLNTNISAIIANNALQEHRTACLILYRNYRQVTRLTAQLMILPVVLFLKKMRVQLRGLSQSDNNVTDGISVLNTAEGVY